MKFNFIIYIINNAYLIYFLMIKKSYLFIAFIYYMLYFNYKFI